MIESLILYSKFMWKRLKPILNIKGGKEQKLDIQGPKEENKR